MTTGTLELGFDNAWWLPEGHSQTLWRKFRPDVALSQDRQRIELSDGDFIDIDWVRTRMDEAAGNAPDACVGSATVSNAGSKHVVVLIHGLCGCSRSSYILSLQKELLSSGITSVAMNLRGSGNSVNRLARSYHSGESGDLKEVINALRTEHPSAHFSLVGFSLGANLMLKYLAENSACCNINKAVAVSTPFELADCSARMCSGLPRVYGNYFLRTLRATLDQKRGEFETRGNSEQLTLIKQLGDTSRIRTLWEFDDLVTAPLHGFNDASDYYQRCSSRNFLAQNSTPTLLIQAKDDPIIPITALPEASELPDSMSLELYDGGGHVGFVARKENWLEQKIVCYLEL